MVFIDPASGVPIEAKGHGQAVLAIDLQPIANEMGKAAARLRERQPGQVGKLDRKRYVVHNAWVVAGTRIPTEAIWNFHEAGYSTKAIIAEYPRLVPAEECPQGRDHGRNARSGRMLLRIDENVPNSVAEFPVIATIGDRLAAIVVTWDRDFEDLVKRIPEGNRAKFRRLGRLSFRCNEVRGRQLIEKWIELVEFHYQQALRHGDFRMIVQIQENALKVL